jgi:hypothetical protein
MSSTTDSSAAPAHLSTEEKRLAKLEERLRHELMDDEERLQLRERTSASAASSASRPRSYAPCITHPGPVLCWAPAISCACTNYPITPAVDNFLSASPGPFGPGPSQKIRHLGDAALSGWGL